MKQNEKVATLQSDDLNKELINKNTMEHLNNNNKNAKFQLKLIKKPKSSKLSTTSFRSFVCDECAAPLSLYGANFIESYSKGSANVLRCLCDLHAEAFGFLGVNA